LTGQSEGDWKPNWLVIGFEDLCGDPLFVDIESAGFPVFTAAHGMENWKAI
jgi:hypothetical protein